MEEVLRQKIKDYIETHAAEAERLVKDLSVIPAPSGKEKRRASFIMNWLRERGAQGLYEDEAGNVILPYEAKKREKLFVYMAHMDVVFPDEDKLIIRQKGHLLCGPGVGDDTANLASLLMCAAYFLEKRPALSKGILFVADTCEEGLGNLKGVKQLFADYGDRICQLVSFDLYLGQCFHESVGSIRYRVTVNTQGGHSFSSFGNPNAIAQASKLICRLYEQTVPAGSRTTYNVGTVTGGTSVNTIAQEASFLYEIRSTDQLNMKTMQESFEAIMTAAENEGICLEVLLLGERPCAGPMTEENSKRQEKLLARTKELIRQVTNKEAVSEPASTDANWPLSLGIPALTLGTIVGGGAHTRQEWIDLDSIKTGLLLALSVVLDFF